MTIINRRMMMLGGSACAAAAFGAQDAARAHTLPDPAGAWSPLAAMPFPVQEIYPAPFLKGSLSSANGKPRPFDIIVNAGGLTPNGDYNVTDAVTFYDPAYDKWGYGPKLPAPRHHIALVNNNGRLYGIGGFARDKNGGWQMRSDCWRLDSLDSDWRAIRPLPHPQGEVVCQSVSGFIHVAGGRAPAGSKNREWGDHIDTDEHWIYDHAADKWASLAPMPTARNSAAGAVVGGTLYVIGGRTVSDGNTAVVEVYDRISDRWEAARPMPKAQAGLAAGVINGKIYAFGGEYFSPGGGGVFAECWEYDPRTDIWRAVAAMPRKRHGLGAVTIDNTIYVLGGAAKAGGEETSADLDKFEI